MCKKLNTVGIILHRKIWIKNIFNGENKVVHKHITWDNCRVPCVCHWEEVAWVVCTGGVQADW